MPPLANPDVSAAMSLPLAPPPLMNLMAFKTLLLILTPAIVAIIGISGFKALPIDTAVFAIVKNNLAIALKVVESIASVINDLKFCVNSASC